MTIGPMTERNDDAHHPRGSQVDYTPATRAQRLGEADKALQEELEKDSGVQSARAALSQAQAKLELAQQHRNTIPWAPYNRRNDQQYRTWQNAVAGVTAGKEAVRTAEKAVRMALNDAAASRTSARFRAQEQERTARQEAEVARHSMLEEAAFHEAAFSAHIASGGTKESFDSAFPGLWRAELARRTKERMGQQEKELRASGRYQL